MIRVIRDSVPLWHTCQSTIGCVHFLHFLGNGIPNCLLYRLWLASLAPLLPLVFDTAIFSSALLDNRTFDRFKSTTVVCLVCLPFHTLSWNFSTLPQPAVSPSLRLNGCQCALSLHIPRMASQASLDLAVDICQ